MLWNDISQAFLSDWHLRYINGFVDQKKPLITPYSALHMAILTVADTIFLTNLQKRENRRNDSPLDNIKMQVA